MKIIKAKIKVDHSTGGTSYIYPALWLDHKEEIPMVVYPGDRSDEVTEGAETFQICYPVVPDALYTQMLADHPEIFSIPNKTEFETYADKHYPQKQMITDQDKVLAILAKAALGETLTKEDKDAIDPTKKDVSGIVLSEKVTDVAYTKYGATI